MTAIAALSLMDGQATPVAHTFSPVNIDSNGIAKWCDRSLGISVGFPSVTQALRSPTKTNRNYKLSVRIAVPVLEVTSPNTMTGIQPAPTKAYDLLASIEIVMPERSTQAQRKDLLAFVRAHLANAVMTTAVQDYEAVY